MRTSVGRIVKGFPRYRVDRQGRIYRKGALILLTGQADPADNGPGRLWPIVAPVPRNGYQRVRLLGPGGRWHWRPVHVVVLESFVGPRPTSRHHGAHGPDRDKANNRLSSLRWATPEENERDKREHGTAPRGGKRNAVTTERVKAIRSLHKGGMSFAKIGEQFGLHPHSVSRIVRGLRRA